MGGSQDVGIDRPVFGRRRKDGDGRHAGHFGRDDIHEDRRGIGCRTARHVHANPLDGRIAGAKADAVAEGVHPRFLFLPFVIGPDVIPRFRQDIHEFRPDFRYGFVDLLCRDQETIKAHAVKFFC